MWQQDKLAGFDTGVDVFACLDGQEPFIAQPLHGARRRFEVPQLGGYLADRIESAIGTDVLGAAKLLAAAYAGALGRPARISVNVLARPAAAEHCRRYQPDAMPYHRHEAKHDGQDDKEAHQG